VRGIDLLKMPAMALILCGSVAHAQLTAFPATPGTPQALSRDELDAYGLVFEAAKPEETIALAEQFLNAYPGSQFRTAALLYRMHAYEALDDFDGVGRSAQEVLRSSPNDIDALSTIASAIANRVPQMGPEREKRLAEAEQYARRSHESLQKLHQNRSVPRKQFHDYKGQAEALNAAVFGLIALHRQDFAKAIQEFEVATTLNSQPRGVDFYRLGVAYRLSKQEEKALQNLEKASRQGPALVRALAETQIRAIKENLQP
jgi:tetratricopeptide (TPR) repeat protein